MGTITEKTIIKLNGKSMTINQWIINDPETIDAYLRKKGMELEKSLYLVLSSKLQTEHSAYYKKTRHLKVYINNYYKTSHVMAQIAYDEDPVKFYKWLSKHPGEVVLSMVQKIRLIDKVRAVCPSCLQPADRQTA